jgi:hypothetical protein
VLVQPVTTKLRQNPLKQSDDRMRPAQNIFILYGEGILFQFLLYQKILITRSLNTYVTLILFCVSSTFVVRVSISFSWNHLALCLTEIAVSLLEREREREKETVWSQPILEAGLYLLTFMPSRNVANTTDYRFVCSCQYCNIDTGQNEKKIISTDATTSL